MVPFCKLIYGMTLVYTYSAMFSAQIRRCIDHCGHPILRFVSQGNADRCSDLSFFLLSCTYAGNLSTDFVVLLA